jgi:predicted transcriptional regulator
MKKTVFIPNSEKQILSILQEVKLQRGTTIKCNNEINWQQLSSRLSKLVDNKDILVVGSNRHNNLGLIQLGKDVRLNLEPNGFKTKAVFEKIRKNKIF